MIVPTLDEADGIEETLRVTRATLGADAELVVVDGGSRDGTPARAAPWARVLAAERGRARQMNAGARAAHGDLLLFLHADTHLPAGTRTALEAALADPGVVGGAFRFGLRGPFGRRALGRALRATINFRCRLFRSATGDQAIFCRRAAFDAVGGFAELPLFEDLELYEKMKRMGRMVLLPLAVRTSDRRWREKGVLRTMALHGLLRAAYHLGIPPARLTRAYRPRATP